MGNTLQYASPHLIFLNQTGLVFVKWFNIIFLSATISVSLTDLRHIFKNKLLLSYCLQNKTPKIPGHYCIL